MKKDFQIGLILSATDKATAVINRAFGNVKTGLTGFRKNMASISGTAGTVAAVTGATSAAILAPLAEITDQAIQFEDKMADVAKVLNMRNGSRELESMGATIRQTASYLAKMPGDVAELYANLAQGGVAQKNLDEVAKKAGSVAVAFDIDAGTAGDRYVKTQNALNTSLADTSKVFDSINTLSDKTAAKASQILDYLAAGGAGVARTLNITGQQSAALGSVFISMGKSGEESATIFERMTKGMLNMDKAAGKVYAGAGGGLAGVMAVIEKGRKLTGTERFQYFKAFGEYGNDVSQLANNFEMLQKHLGFVASEQNYLGSVNAEFQNRMATTGTQLRKAKAELNALAIEAGTSLLPVIRDLFTAFRPILTSISGWIRRNPELTAGILKAAAGIAAINGAISLVSGAMAVLTAIASANPIVLIIVGIATAALLIYKYWGPISGFFKNLWEKQKAVLFGAWEFIKSFASKFYQAGKQIFVQLGRGMLSTFFYPVELAAKLGEKIRGFFPHSPAKWGPLKDLHKTDIFGQVAKGLNPAPLKAEINRGLTIATNTAPGANSTPNPVAGAYQNSNSAITFAPVINMTGTGDAKVDILAALKQYEGDFMRFIQNAQRKQARAAY